MNVVFCTTSDNPNYCPPRAEALPGAYIAVMKKGYLELTNHVT